MFIHEMRHVAQFSYFFEPFKNPGKLLSFATFDQSMLMEGDAVLTETLLTNEGRGRNPGFLLEEKTKILNGKNVQYAHFLYHDHYTTGYLFCSYFRKKYGVDNFRKLFERRNLCDGIAWRKGYKNFRIFVDNAFDRFYPLSINHRLKEITGRNISEFFSDITTSAKEKWNKQLENIKISDFEKVNKETKNYINPQKFRDGIIALKTSRVEPKIKSEFNHFVFIKDGKEQWLKEFNGKIFSSNFSCAQGKIIFRGSRDKVRNKKLPRYLKEADNVIFILDAKKNAVKVIDEFPHCQNPIFSHDATKIIFFSPNVEGTPTLIVLDGNNFKTLKKYELEKFHEYKNPIFSCEDKKIFFIDCFNGESRIKVVEGEEVREVYKSKSIIRGLDENEDFIFFGSSLSGIDNIYAFDKRLQQVWQVTSSRYGAYHPHVVDDMLVYNDYNDKCYFDIAKVKINKENWTPIEKVEDKNVYLFDGLQEQEKKVIADHDQINYESHKIKNYRIVPLSYLFFNKEIRKSEKHSGDFLQNKLYKHIYDTWIGGSYYDYYSGISFGFKYKSNSKSNLINANVGYLFFDMHNVDFETTLINISNNKTTFFSENILSYKLFWEKMVGKNFLMLSPGVKADVKNDEEGWTLNFLFNIYSEFETFQSKNTTFFAVEKSNAFLSYDFIYDFDRKNSINIGAYAFKIDIDGIKKTSMMFKILDRNKLTSGLEKLSSSKVEKTFDNFRQIGLSFGYMYLIPLNYSLEHLNDEFYCLFLKSIKIKPEFKVDILTFDNNEYKLLCNADLNILRATTIHTSVGVKFNGGKVSFAPFDFSLNWNLFGESSEKENRTPDLWVMNPML